MLDELDFRRKADAAIEDLKKSGYFDEMAKAYPIKQ